MSQSDVLELFQKEKKPMTVKEISEMVDINPTNVNKNCKRLFENGIIDRTNIRDGGLEYLYELTEKFKNTNR